MNVLVPSNKFIKELKKLDHQSRERIKNTMVLMRTNLKHPSLRVKKMRGYRNPDIWETSASMNLRITFEFDDLNRIILRNCGHHNPTLRNP